MGLGGKKDLPEILLFKERFLAKSKSEMKIWNKYCHVQGQNSCKGLRFVEMKWREKRKTRSAQRHWFRIHLEADDSSRINQCLYQISSWPTGDQEIWSIRVFLTNFLYDQKKIFPSNMTRVYNTTRHLIYNTLTEKIHNDNKIRANSSDIPPWNYPNNRFINRFNGRAWW